MIKTNNTNIILKNAIFEIVNSFNTLLLASNVSIGFTER